MTITQEELKKILHYDPEIGVFTWLLKKSNRIKVGQIAGSRQVDILCGKAYIRIKISKKMYLAHRLAVLYITGNLPENEVDHLDGNGTNNKWKNIRCVSAIENQRNRRLQSNNSSGIGGVYWHVRNGKWHVRTWIGSKLIHLGYYDNLLDAASVKKSAEIKYGFHKNHGSNRPL